MLVTLLRRARGGRAPHKVPADGFEPLLRDPAQVDSLSASDLASVNALLPWACFTADRGGRRVGAPSSVTKRPTAQEIPDQRILRLEAAVGLHDKHVVELGCFEGVHTVALCDLVERVTAVDARVENVVKTMVRTWLYGHRPEVVLQDVEDPAVLDVYDCDVLHHNGVLYHLLDPVAHLRRALSRTRTALLLDTHISRESETTAHYDVDGHTFRIKDFKEDPHTSPFAGLYPNARWLLLDDLRAEIERAGFGNIMIEEVREERHGARVLIIAKR